ncbi:uncharacterized protein LOC141532999 [Cotesia typhae]|uniref:uncharacterized protein LOC141532999 n=1 Tax=Cotesia typhae TaxID=2053667 RepID=UPI003D688B83
MQLSNMDLAKLNKVNCLVGILPVKKMNELKFNREYKIKGLKQVSTQYGSKIVANIEDGFVIYLPARAAVLLKGDGVMEMLNDLSESNHLFMRYHGGKYNKFEFINSTLDVNSISI